MATIHDCANRQSKELYEEVKKDYEEAYKCVDRALLLDEEGKTDEAISMYEFGLSLIDVALGKPIESPREPDLDWERTYAMIQKLRKTRKEILCRISDAQSRPRAGDAVPPPSYDEAMASSSPACPFPSSATMAFPHNYEAAATPYIPSSATYDANIHNSLTPTYADLNSQLDSMRVSGNREIIYSHNNVLLYFIAPDGRVSATTEPDTLIIGRIEDLTHDDVLDDVLLDIVDSLKENDDEKKGHRSHRHRHHRRHRRHHSHNSDPSRQLSQGSGQIYLQVGSWVYPLIPGISPCYRADYGAFILPDVHSEVSGAAVGLILPPTADSSVYDLLSQILLGVIGKEDLQPKAPSRARRSDRADKRASTTFSTNVVKGATYLANNLVRGAGSASRLIDAAAPRIMNRITPVPEPQPVNPALKTSLGAAKTASGSAAKATGYLAGKVGQAASALGQYLAPHIQRQGTKLLSSTTKLSPDEASNKMDTFLEGTAGAVQGIATVYGGLETAASILGRSLSNNTVQIIQYKYGQPTAEAAGDAISTGENLLSVYGDTKILKPKGMAKTVAKGAAKGAGKSILEDIYNNWPHAEFHGSGPGAGGGFRSTLVTEPSAPPLQANNINHTSIQQPLATMPVPAPRNIPSISATIPSNIPLPSSLSTISSATDTSLDKKI